MTKIYKPKKKDEILKDKNLPYISKEDYIVLVLGGHVGHGYGIPFLHWIRATSQEEAELLAANLPHVKHHKRDAVILCMRRSRKEGLFIKLVNDLNPYLTSSAMSGRDFAEERIRTAGYIAGLIDEFRKTGDPKLFNELLSIKCGSDFDDNHPLQQACAPVWVFDNSPLKKNATEEELLEYYRWHARLVSPENIDGEAMLKAFYTIETKTIAMVEVEEPGRIKETRRGIETLDPTILSDDTRLLEFRDFEFDSLRRVQMLMIYNKVMGGNNPLGIRYDAKNHMMTYPSLDDPNRIVSVPIPNVPYIVANDMFLNIKGPQLNAGGLSDDDKKTIEDFNKNMKVTIEERLILGTQEDEENKDDEVFDELSK